MNKKQKEEWKAVFVIALWLFIITAFLYINCMDINVNKYLNKYTNMFITDIKKQIEEMKK